MIEVIGGLHLLQLDKAKYTRSLNRALGIVIREAAREWLRAVITSVPSRGGFPVLTGAAKSTLAPLGRFLRVAIGDTSPVGKLDRRSEGEKASSFKITDDKTASSDFVYEFEWSNDILHYYLNEFYQMPTVASSPWHSLDAGRAAFIKYVEENLPKRIPNIADYISPQVIQTGD